MNIQFAKSNPYNNTQAMVNTFGRAEKILVPAKEKAIKLAKERPLLIGGAFLTFITFIVSLMNKTTQKLLPVFGIPAISLFVYQIFFNSKNIPEPNKTLQKKEIEKPEISCFLQSIYDIKNKLVNAKQSDSNSEQHDLCLVAEE
ncbi:MAG: hypothetical protein HY094_04115 [Candidatus Melainabacteria bacterium]|nr:hypothetical protein [Candidatus Melainabacteria bacterium]